MTKPAKGARLCRRAAAAGAGIALGVVAGHIIGSMLHSDNMPLFQLLGAAAGLCAGIGAGFAATVRRHRREELS